MAKKECECEDDERVKEDVRGPADSSYEKIRKTEDERIDSLYNKRMKLFNVLHKGDQSEDKRKTQT